MIFHLRKNVPVRENEPMDFASVVNALTIELSEGHPVKYNIRSEQLFMNEICNVI